MDFPQDNVSSIEAAYYRHNLCISRVCDVTCLLMKLDWLICMCCLADLTYFGFSCFDGIFASKVSVFMLGMIYFNMAVGLGFWRA